MVYCYKCIECEKEFEAEATVEDRHKPRCNCGSQREPQIVIKLVTPKHGSWSQWKVGE